MAKVKLTELYKSLKESPFYDDEDDLLGDFDAQLKKDMAKAGYGTRDTNKIFKRGDDAKFAKDDDQAPGQKKKTYGDLSPKEFEKMRADMGMKTDDEGNRYIDDPDAPPVDQLVKGNVEKIMVKLGGDAKTELKVSNQMDDQGNIDLSNITLEFKDKKYEGLEFEYEDEVEDHGSVKVLLFTAEAEDGTIFEVEVDAGAQYDLSNIVDDINWRSLETFPSKEDQQGITEKAKSGKRPDYADVDGDGDEEESMEKAFKDKEKIDEYGPYSPTDKDDMDEYGCSEQEIAEGTCGYAPDGEIDVYNTSNMEPAGPQLISVQLQERFKKLAGIIKD